MLQTKAWRVGMLGNCVRASVRRTSERKGIAERLACLLPPKPLNKKARVCPSGMAFVPPWLFYGLVVMPNVIKEMNCGCALLSQVRMHTKRRRK